MRGRVRIGRVLLLLALVAGAKLAHQGYRWFAYQDEREQVRTLTAELEEAAVEVVRTYVAADSLRASIEDMDRRMEQARRGVQRFGGQAVDGALPPLVYGAYRRQLDGYNRRVVERNARFEAWRDVIARNHEAVRRYNDLSDRIRTIAAEAGDPYYPIPTPAEIASDHGIVAPGR